MSSKKRHIGRRMVGVGALTALFVLGLEAPALAAPAVSAISPGNGPVDCVVVVTGTAFTESPAAQTTVDFTRTGDTNNDADFSIISATEMWVTVPGGLDVGQSYNIRIETPVTGTTGVTSTASFLVTTAAGACAPTITSFTPGCASAGDTVVITGTNLITAEDFNGNEQVGADVWFAPYDTAALPVRLAAHTVPDVDTPTSLSVVVPSLSTSTTNSGTIDGPIKVTTEVGAGGTTASAFSAASFLVPPPDCAPATGNEHSRSITLKLKKSGAASGVVASTEETPFTACVSEVPVKFKFKPKGKSWKNAGSTTTDDQGNYSKKLKGKPGKYKAIAAKVSIGDPVTDVCLKARSPVRKIK